MQLLLELTGGQFENGKIKVESGKLWNADAGLQADEIIGMGGLIWALVAMIGPSCFSIWYLVLFIGYQFDRHYTRKSVGCQMNFCFLDTDLH